MTFHTKLLWLQNRCVLGLIQQIYDGNLSDVARYLVLHDAIYDKIRYLISEKIVLNIVLFINLQDSYNFLFTEKTMTFHNVIILIKSVFSKNKSSYYLIYF